MRKSVDNYLTCYSELEDVDHATTEAAADIAFSSKGLVSDEMFGRKKALVEEIDSTILALAESLRLAKFQLSELFVQGPGKDVEHYRKTVDSLGGLVAAFAETVVFIQVQQANYHIIPAWKLSN